MMVVIDSGIDEESKRKIIGVISVLIPDASIYLFGSRARRTHSKWSDIDVALDTGSEISRFVIGEVMSMLEASNILYKIQIVDIHSVSEAMRESIMRERIIWKK